RKPGTFYSRTEISAMTRVSTAVFHAVLLFFGLNIRLANAWAVPEIGGPSPAVQISGSRFGGDFFCAVQQDSTVQCWGKNDLGQLADGSTAGEQASPVFVKATTKARSINLTNAFASTVGGINAWPSLAIACLR